MKNDAKKEMCNQDKTLDYLSNYCDDNPFKPLSAEEICSELAQSRTCYERGEYVDFDNALDEIANTRMRDYYDVYMLVQNVDFSWSILKDAFTATCNKRGTDYSQERISRELELIDNDKKLEANWSKFKKKNFFAEALEWRHVIESITDSVKKVIG